ncbi:MAG: hypothetical protein C5B59_00485 [Bacteroidetes bacterium]|nr:MAG: hypothetical protein C5B59_00485 [Bacteroidota bacterium]
MKHEYDPTPAQAQVIQYLQGLNLNHLEASEHAHRNLPSHLREIYTAVKRVCNKVFLPQARSTLCECLAEFYIGLLESAEEFAGLPEQSRQEFALSLAKKAAYKIARKPMELQPFPQTDRDIRIKSGAQPRYFDEEDDSPDGHYRHPDWITMNEYENSLIEKIDAKRSRQPAPEPAYERCVRLLGETDANWFWSVKSNHDTYRQRHPEHRVLTNAETVRYHRLKRKVGGM